MSMVVSNVSYRDKFFSFSSLSYHLNTVNKVRVISTDAAYSPESVQQNVFYVSRILQDEKNSLDEAKKSSVSMAYRSAI
jgi:hypothetical protein